jgi:hypothetical protein
MGNNYHAAEARLRVKLGENPTGKPAIIPLIVTPSLSLKLSKSRIIILSLPIPNRARPGLLAS